MGRFRERLEAGDFVVTGEFTPPKGTDLSEIAEKAEFLRDFVDAVNLTDSHRARMTMAPVGAAKLLLERGVDPIVQVTGRDRNRIAVQAELLAAASLGVENLLCMSGDNPAAGDHPDAKPVFDLEAIGLLRAVAALNAGRDLGGAELSGTPQFCAGAVANPGADDLETELGRLEQKLSAGARFFQTQPVFDIDRFETFSAHAESLGAAIIPGVLLLKSAKMGRMLNENVPGIHIPESTLKRLESSDDRRATSVEIAAEIVAALRPIASGVHFMAIGWERHIPSVLEAAGAR